MFALLFFCTWAKLTEIFQDAFARVISKLCKERLTKDENVLHVVSVPLNSAVKTFSWKIKLFDRPDRPVELIAAPAINSENIYIRISI